ncbi:MAG: DEAD/DEAH box helicase [Bacteroidales bacterium]
MQIEESLFSLFGKRSANAASLTELLSSLNVFTVEQFAGAFNTKLPPTSKEEWIEKGFLEANYDSFFLIQNDLQVEFSSYFQVGEEEVESVKTGFPEASDSQPAFASLPFLGLCSEHVPVDIVAESPITMAVESQKLPGTFVLPKLPDIPVFNQGSRGTCVANAATFMVDYLTGSKTSRQFLYHQCKMIDGHPNSGGTWMNIPFDVLCKKDLIDFGTVAEEKWVYNPAQASSEAQGPPPEACFAVDRYEGLAFSYTNGAENIVNIIKGVLTGEKTGKPLPFIIGLPLFKAFFSTSTARNGWVTMPLPGEKPAGYHAMTVTGYFDDIGMFLVRNSWGQTWAAENQKGFPGHALIPYNYLARYYFGGGALTEYEVKYRTIPISQRLYNRKKNSSGLFAHEAISQYLRDKNIILNDMQLNAVNVILNTGNHLVISASTGTGKTEAAFLPALDSAGFPHKGVRILYVGPLKALINDQVARMTELAELLGVNVTKWHGDASGSAKEKTFSNPEGVVFITPESIESQFSRGGTPAVLFGSLDFIIVDEMHSFIGSERGDHLRSLLSRIKELSQNVRFIGLSATLESHEEVARFFGQPERTTILGFSSPKKVHRQVGFFYEEENREVPEGMISEIESAIRDQKVLVFANSRSKIEKIISRLGASGKKQSLMVRPHYSNISRNVREETEKLAKTGKDEPSCIISSSTLELGIDIGDLDFVIQLNSPGSPSALVQRMGRSGRGRNSDIDIRIYCTTPWDLVKSVAAMELVTDTPPRLEKRLLTRNPFDILFHQTLSILKEHPRGILISELVQKLTANFAFENIRNEIPGFLEAVTGLGYITKEGFQYRINEGGTAISKQKFFLSFDLPSLFSLFDAAGKAKLGDIPLTMDLQPGDHINFSGKSWRIIHIDKTSLKIKVTETSNTRGKALCYRSNEQPVSQIIMQQSRELLLSAIVPGYLNPDAANMVQHMGRIFRENAETIPWLRGAMEMKTETGSEIYPFAGTRIERTLQFIFENSTLHNEISFDAGCHKFILKNADPGKVSLASIIGEGITNFDVLVEKALQQDPDSFPLPRWGKFLDVKYKTRIIGEKWFDINGLRALFSDSK